MTYETLDWDAEAKRVARAFGLEGKCEFEEYNNGQVPEAPDGPVPVLGRVLWQNDAPYIVLPSQKGRVFMCQYLKNSDRSYWVEMPHEEGQELKTAIISLSSTGEISSVITDDYIHVFFLAKALFHLDLLAPEVEAALKVSVSAHQKLEWKLEYEERYGSFK